MRSKEQGDQFAQEFADLLAKYGFTNGYLVASDTSPYKQAGLLFFGQTKLLSPVLQGYFKATKEAIDSQHPIEVSPNANQN